MGDGEHGLIDKCAMYEPSIRVPLIAHCPDLFAGGARPEGRDPAQMQKLLGDVRIRAEGGRLFQRIQQSTGGRREPTWKA